MPGLVGLAFGRGRWAGFAYTLRDGGEESIEDPRGHEGVERRGCGAPDRCCNGEHHEPE